MLAEMKVQKQLLEGHERDLQEKKDLVALYLRERNEARAQIHNLEASRQSERVGIKYDDRSLAEGIRKIHSLWC